MLSSGGFQGYSALDVAVVLARDADDVGLAERTGVKISVKTSKDQVQVTVIKCRAMHNQSSWCGLFVAVLACSALGQQSKPLPSVDTSGPAAEVLALEKKIEDAVVRGDVAYVDSVLASDFSFVHGDAWTTGGKPLASDDKPSTRGSPTKST